MVIIGDLAGIVAFVLFFRLIYLIFKCRKAKNWKPFKKEGIIFLICFILASVFADTSSSKNDSTDTTNKTEKVSKKKNNPKVRSKLETKSNKVENKQSSNSSASKTSSVNDDLKKSLSENQSYAQKGNSDFAFASYINGVKYTGSNELTVYVNNDFTNLPDKTKTDYLNQVQGMAQSVLLDKNKISDDDCREGLFITINVGQNSIGTSKITNHKEYHFNK